MAFDDLTVFLSGNPVFRRDELADFLAERGMPSAEHFADTRIHELKKAGWIVGIRRNLYALTVSPTKDLPLWPDPFLVAAKIYPDGVIGYTGALHLHLDLLPPGVIRLLTVHTQRQFVLDGDGVATAFHGVRPSCFLGNWANEGVVTLMRAGMELRATSREQTLADLLDRWNFVDDQPSCMETLEGLFSEDGPPLDQQFLCTYLRQRGNATGAARLGAFLERHQFRFGIHAKTLRDIEGMRPGDLTYWDPQQKGAASGRKHPRWNLVIPEALSGWLPWDTYDERIGVQTLEGAFDCSGHDPQREPTRLDDSLDAGNLEDEKDPGSQPEMDRGVPLNAAGEPLKTWNYLEPAYRDKVHPEGIGQEHGLLPLLQERFGYPAFREGQESTLQTLLAGEDAVAILPTGGGKSLIYQLWAMVKGGLVLVVSPLIALMEDQVEEALKLNLRAAYLHSGLESGTRELVLTHAMEGTLDLLFISPESLFPLLWSAPWLSTRITLAVVDEAHCISLWGHEFRPAYRDLHNLRHKLGSKPILGLTATATDLVKRSIISHLELRNPYVHSGPVSRSNLHLAFREVPGGLEARLPHLLDFLNGREGQQGIIYCATRSATERVAEHLAELGLAAKAYHAGLESPARRMVHRAFMDGACKIVVATIAFGMGLNKKDVRFVIHMNLPSSIEGYVQEIGRAGRDGERGDCLLLHSHGDFVFQRILAARSINRGTREGNVWGVRSFAGSDRCRHQMIAHHFGQTTSPCVNRCDHCQANP